VAMTVVVVVLQRLLLWRIRSGPGSRAGRRTLLAGRVASHGRRGRTETERERKHVSHDAPEAPTKHDVDDEVGGRIDDHQQLADYSQV